MTAHSARHSCFRQWLPGVLLVVGATAIAVISARPYAGSWNDGSRLATVEALVDHHSLAIDSSIFVKVPASPLPCHATPYPADDPGLITWGTQDKLFINGHF